jgi:predicted transcriptional regulator
MVMEFRLPPELESKVAEMAAEQGRDASVLVEVAVERMLAAEAWFRTEVNKGLEAAARGEFIEDDEIRRMIDSRYPG